MRVGYNPHKDQPTDKRLYQHQVVMPVSIPSNEGYFRDAFQILQLCLKSLFTASHSATFITVVNNNSTAEVAQYLDGLLAEGKIHEVIHTGGIGKTNAVLKGLAGHQFPLVTITDADVLFLSHWQQAAYTIFDAFPQAGAVCTTPLSRRLRYFTENIYVDLFFSKRLRFTPVKDPEAMIAFAKSIANPTYLQDVHLQHNLTITAKNHRAIVGAGHFCCTYKGTIFKHISGYAKGKSTYAGGHALTQTIDEPVAAGGYWRLSTEQNYTFHMGNVVEPWMFKQLDAIQPPQDFHLPALVEQSVSAWGYFIKHILMPKLVRQPLFWRFFLLYKGLRYRQAVKYF